jgi:hypothetical protein
MRDAMMKILESAGFEVESSDDGLPDGLRIVSGPVRESRITTRG